MRVRVVVVTLLFPLLLACDLVMPPPEPPPEIVLMILPGLLEFDQDTVRMNIGDTLILKKWPLVWDPDIGPFPELGPGEVLAPFRSFLPRVIRCTDVAREVHCVPGAVPDEGRSLQQPSTGHADPRRRVHDGSDRPRPAMRSRRERRPPDRRGVAVERRVRRVRDSELSHHRGRPRHRSDPLPPLGGRGLRAIVGIEDGKGRLGSPVAGPVRRLRAHLGPDHLLNDERRPARPLLPGSSRSPWALHRLRGRFLLPLDRGCQDVTGAREGDSYSAVSAKALRVSAKTMLLPALASRDFRVRDPLSE